MLAYAKRSILYSKSLIVSTEGSKSQCKSAPNERHMRPVEGTAQAESVGTLKFEPLRQHQYHFVQRL